MVHNKNTLHQTSQPYRKDKHYIDKNNQLFSVIDWKERKWTSIQMIGEADNRKDDRGNGTFK